MEGLSEALLQEVAPLGIKVTMVAPSATETAVLSNLAFTEVTGTYDGTVGEVQRAIANPPAGSGVDPVLAAATIPTVVEAQTPPARIILGAQGEQAIRTAFEGRLAELSDWSSVAHSADKAA